MHPFTRTATAAALLAALGGLSHAAEGFQLRYNLAGSLGGEMFTPPEQAGWAASVAATHVKLDKVTGDDGQTLTLAVPAGRAALPAPTPASAYPAYAAGTVRIDGTGTLKQFNFALAYLTPDRHGGGRLVFGLMLPYAVKQQAFGAVGATPALQWGAGVPAATQAAFTTQFGAAYQARLATLAAGESGEVSGLGDAELSAGWLYADERLRLLAGGALVLPTGKYNAAAGPDVGLGHFYTFRPALQAAYLVTPDLSLSGKLTAGLNTRNKDTDVRSGNWAGLELAVGYKTPIGVAGVHAIRVQQVQDDSNNPWGASRLRADAQGVFFTTRLPVVDAALTLQYMAMSSSRNAKQGDVAQLRVTKLF